MYLQEEVIASNPSHPTRRHFPTRYTKSTQDSKISKISERGGGKQHATISLDQKRLGVFGQTGKVMCCLEGKLSQDFQSGDSLPFDAKKRRRDRALGKRGLVV